jgi:hypothetical protein
MNAYFFLDPIELEKEIIPLIYEGPGNIPTGFNGVAITLNATSDSSLDWQQACQQARESIDKGYFIFWKLDLGLFDRLKMPLSDPTQFMALQLALKHFREKIWFEFSSHTFGASIFEGDLDFSKSRVWNHVEQQESYQDGIQQLPENERHPEAWKLFCREAALDYIQLISKQLPGEMSTYLLLNASSITDPLLLIELLEKDKYGELHRALSGSRLPVNYLALEPKGGLGGVKNPSTDTLLPISLGFCLPESLNKNTRTKAKKAIDQLIAQKSPFRVLTESTLASEWDGLDQLLVVPETLTLAGKRKLQGFCAAGGEVIEV